MAGQIKRVLSIDWDYFQDVTKKQIINYPDGNETLGELNNLVWAVRYSDMYPNFDPREISINKKLYDEMMNIIKFQTKGTPARIAESHAQCYNFIKYEFNPGDIIELYNVDLHHDLFNDNEEEMNCGNWILYLMKSYEVYLSWFNRSVSLEAYKLSKKNKDMRMYTDSLDEIKHTLFDAVFLCRSGAWIPPHLDPMFEKMGNVIASRCKTRFVPDRDVLLPRSVCENMITVLNGHVKNYDETRRTYETLQSKRY